MVKKDMIACVSISINLYTYIAGFDNFQIAGTSKDFQRKKQNLEMGSGSDSEESMNNNNRARTRATRNKIQSFTPSTPPHQAPAKRRKGVPHRSPMSGLVIEY